MRAIGIRFGFALTWAVLVSILDAGTGRAELRINEVLADPATDWNGDGVVHSRDDEWVEIVNLSAVATSLDGVRLASQDTTWRYEFSGSLPAGGAIVVFGDQSHTWEQESGNPAFGLRLTNTGGTIGLWRVSDADTVRLEEVSYLDEDAEDDRSAGRLAEDPEEWVLFDALNPYDGAPPPFSTGCPPTPGFTNECLTPVSERSWGEIKEIYWGTLEE